MLILQEKSPMGLGYSEDLVGEALQVLYEKHGYKREDLFIQTK
jgi:diketogulonate reductase-like aldo/keto reductase